MVADQLVKARRSPAVFVFLPIGAYLAAMLALAIFVVHPPLLGWIGLAVVAAIALLLATAAVRLFPRLRANAVRLHPRPGAVWRLLVVVDADVEPASLCSAIRTRLRGRWAEVRVVVPVTTTRLHFLTDDEHAEQDAAARRVRAVLRELADAGIRAQGRLGTDDPLQALGDELRRFRANEILLIAPLPAQRSWLERDFERQARDLFGIHVSTAFLTESPPTDSDGFRIRSRIPRRASPASPPG